MGPPAKVFSRVGALVASLCSGIKGYRFGFGVSFSYEGERWPADPLAAYLVSAIVKGLDKGADGHAAG